MAGPITRVDGGTLTTARGFNAVVVAHHLAPTSTALTLPSVGTAVTGVIDWGRRYQLMRTHTAMHILCGVVWRDYGAQVTGGNMQPLNGRMDFEF